MTMITRTTILIIDYVYLCELLTYTENKIIIRYSEYELWKNTLSHTLYVFQGSYFVVFYTIYTLNKLCL